MSVNILFLCVGNSARSQIAEALARKCLGGKAVVQSAGSKPVGFVHPNAILTMREIGIEIGDYKSKRIEDLPEPFLSDLDYVITLCKEEVCPLFITKAKKLHWLLYDPASSPVETIAISFRETREQLTTRLNEFCGEILISTKF